MRQPCTAVPLHATHPQPFTRGSGVLCGGLRSLSNSRNCNLTIAHSPRINRSIDCCLSRPLSAGGTIPRANAGYSSCLGELLSTGPEQHSTAVVHWLRVRSFLTPHIQSTTHTNNRNCYVFVLGTTPVSKRRRNEDTKNFRLMTGWVPRLAASNTGQIHQDLPLISCLE